MCDRIGLPIPPLRIPGEKKQDLYKLSFLISAPAAAFLWFLAVAHGWLELPTALLCVVLWIALMMACFKLTTILMPSLANGLPADTAGDLARVVLSMNYEHFALPPAPSKPTNEDVWRRLVDIICDQLQVGREEVVPNARFADDLGVD